MDVRRTWLQTHRLLLPAVAILIFINAIPILILIYMSITDWGRSLTLSFEEPFVGLSNFIYIFSQPRFWQAGYTTLIWVLGSLALQLPLGLGIALLLARATRRRLLVSRLFNYVMVLPLVVAPVVVGVMWRFMVFEPSRGVLNAFLGVLGIPGIAWLGRSTALFSVILVDVWQHTPLFVLMLFAGLQALPATLYDAAKCDGATGFQLVRHITVPLLAPIVYVVTVIRSIDLLRWIVTIFIMTGGGPGGATEIWNMYLYRLTFDRYNISRGAAMGLFLIFVSLLISIAFVKLTISRESKE